MGNIENLYPKYIAETVRIFKQKVDQRDTPTTPAVCKFVKRVYETGMLIDNKKVSSGTFRVPSRKYCCCCRQFCLNSLQQLNIIRTSLRKILHKDLKLFPYKV